MSAFVLTLSGCFDGPEDHLFESGDRVVYRVSGLQAKRCGGNVGQHAFRVGGVSGDVRRLRTGKTITVPLGSYWLVGRGNAACDSRVFGAVRAEAVDAAG